MMKYKKRKGSRLKKKIKILVKIILRKNLKNVLKDPRSIIISTLQVTIGSALMAISTNLLYVPHELLSGGIAGIALMFHYLFDLNLGLTVFILNIPLFIVAIRFLNITFITQSALAMGLYSVIVNYTSPLQDKLQLNDTMLVAIFAGIISGAGLGLIFRGKGSFGGTDIIAMIVKEKYSISIGTTNFLFNIAILALGAVLFNVEVALYTLIAAFVASVMTDKASTGFGNQKAMLIISDKGKEIAYVLTHKLKLAATLIEGQGAWALTNKTVVFIVVPTMRMSRIRYISLKIDPNCFITVISTNEITGGKKIIDSSEHNPDLFI